MCVKYGSAVCALALFRSWTRCGLQQQGESFNIYPCGLFIRVLINSTRFFRHATTARWSSKSALVLLIANERYRVRAARRVILVPKCYGLLKVTNGA
jgi:hypothetical protein